MGRSHFLVVPRFVTTTVVLLWLLTVCIGSASSAPSPPSLTPGDYDLTITHDDRERYYIVHVPPLAATRHPLPAVLVFHGGGGQPTGQKDWAGFDAIADREGFLAVYPYGTGRFERRLLSWNAGTCCGFAQRNNIDDVGFVVTLLKDLARRTPVDHTRVYATGMSNGAMMSYRLAAEIPERIAAIAPVAGSMVVTSFAPSRPMAIMHFHSVDDPRALYDGGLGPRFPFLTRVMHPAVEASLQQWVEYDECATPPQAGPTIHGTVPGLDTTHTATKFMYTDCRGRAEIVLWKLTGAGHVWPGAEPKFPEWLLGPPTQVLNASEEIWQFFRRFSRPEAPPL